MRVYEFSKKYNIPTKNLLSALDKGGFHINSHMSVLTQNEIDYLHKEFNINTVEKQPRVAKQAPVAEQSISREKKVVKESEKLKPVFEKSIGLNLSKNIQAAHNEFVHSGDDGEILLDDRQMTVDDFSRAVHKSVSEIIITLLKWGIVVAKNQVLTRDVLARLAAHYEIKIKAVVREKVAQEGKGTIEVTGGNQIERLPVVVVMGHVDHGKTTLLDYIRRTRVAAREKGGITQHLGAYETKTSKGNIVFIDTPGHEAFSRMRMRGVKVADIVVLIVAADDSIKPQTIEAIKQAKKMNVPIIVAANKIDRVDISRVDVVKRDMAQHDLLPEDWGGTVVVVPISAKTGQGVDELLDMIILQSQMMELTADVAGNAKGYVLESKLEKGRGVVATVLLQHGKLHVGDYFVCGKTVGKVTSLVNSYGEKVANVGPSHPVRIVGFDDLPEAGDYIEAVSKDVYGQTRNRIEKTPLPARSLVQQDGFNIIIKADSDSSKEALVDAIEKLSKDFKSKFNIVHAAIGDIGEGDISLAATTKSKIFGLHVKAEPNALIAARQNNVVIQSYGIIYKLLEALQAHAEATKEIKMKNVKIGEAEVRRVFDIKGLGVIAGCYVKEGTFSRDGNVVIWRKKHKVGQGKIKSLQRDKKMVKEVHAGFECGFIIDKYSDWAVEDRVECFIEVPDEKANK